MRTQIRNLGMAATTVFALAAGAVGAPSTAMACTANPYIGTVCTISFGFCPRQYAEAAGQLLPINQNTSLFSLIGCTYGGDCRTSFALPDLRGRMPVGIGRGPGLSNYSLGQPGGVEHVTQNVQHLAPHTHSVSSVPITATATLHGTTADADQTSPAGALPATTRTAVYHQPSASAQTVVMADTAVTVTGTASGDTSFTGGGQQIENRQPFLGMRYCIALQGLYPPRN